jgi:hypothetical protein
VTFNDRPIHTKCTADYIAYSRRNRARDSFMAKRSPWNSASSVGSSLSTAGGPSPWRCERQAVLAVRLLRLSQPVPMATVVDKLQGSPARDDGQSSLRNALGAHTVATRRSGYSVQIHGDR